MGTNLRPGDDAGLEYHLGLDAEILRLPEDEIGERPDGDLPDEVGHAMRDGTTVTMSQDTTVARTRRCSRVDGVLRDVTLDPAIVVPFSIS